MTLKEFIRRAKIEGYASGETEMDLGDGGRLLKYSDGTYEYLDVFYGFDPFIGRETVSENGAVIWVMNYTGATNHSFPEETVKLYEFLRLALRNPDIELPVRGPSEFIRENFIYRNSLNGDMDYFHGEEVILYKNVEVYRLLYSGASIWK